MSANHEHEAGDVYWIAWTPREGDDEDAPVAHYGHLAPGRRVSSGQPKFRAYPDARREAFLDHLEELGVEREEAVARIDGEGVE